MAMKSLRLAFSALLPFQLLGVVHASSIQPGFLADRHAKTIHSNTLDSEKFLKFREDSRKRCKKRLYYEADLHGVHIPPVL